MKKSQWLVLLFVMALIAGTAGALTWLKANQKLGRPGIRATPVPGSVKMSFDLPPLVLDFVSTNVPEDKTVLDMLPKDTSYAATALLGARRFLGKCQHYFDGHGPDQHSQTGILPAGSGLAH